MEEEKDNNTSMYDPWQRDLSTILNLFPEAGDGTFIIETNRVKTLHMRPPGIFRTSLCSVLIPCACAGVSFSLAPCEGQVHPKRQVY